MFASKFNGKIKYFIPRQTVVIVIFILLKLFFKASAYEYDTKATDASLKRSVKPYFSIELTCDEYDVSLCEEFRCSAYYSVTDEESIYWSPKTCPDMSCQLNPTESSSTIDELLVSTEIIFDKLESRIRECTTMYNAEGTEDIFNAAVPLNNTDQHFLALVEQSYDYEIFPALQEVRVIWTITLHGHPRPQLRLLPNGKIISSEKYEYEVSQNGRYVFLIIKNITTNDLDTNFYLSAKNEFETRIFDLECNLTKFRGIGIMVHELTATYSIISCSFRSLLPCNTTIWYDSCIDCPENKIKLNTTQGDLQCISFSRIDSSIIGSVGCFASNGFDFKSTSQAIDRIKASVDIFIHDVVTDADGATEQIEGETLDLTCRASAVNHTGDIQWAFKDLEDNINDSRFVHETKYKMFIYQKTLQLPRLGSYNGKYFCKTLLKNGTIEYKAIDLKMSAKNISVTNLEHKFITNVDETAKQVNNKIQKLLILICRASAPKLTKEVQLIWSDLEQNASGSRLSKLMETRTFGYQKSIQLPGLELYNFTKNICTRILKNNTFEHRADDVNVTVNNNWAYYAIIAVLLTIVISISVFIRMRIRRHHKLQKQIEELNIVDLANFEKGALEHLNPNLSIDDQADLLPYDKRYEFPIERLKLGEQIGSGAFGIVVKAEASGILENETNTIVAIKMVNRSSGDIYIKALASELKIMIHLGNHVNIVNLLGACTRNIAKRELLVVVEYCRFGNLKDYLLHHRHSFVHQVNAETGQIDLTIGGDALGVHTSIHEFTYITPCFSNRFYEVTTTMLPLAEPGMKSICTETQEAQVNFHYKGDYRNINKPVCTTDLLLWSFQIARGMEYLSSRKVLHGDLAARNVLLTDGNVVKICDFGLSKTMYQKDVYKRTGDEMLPVKWMAIEAITDRIFSFQSDVWSFGIVLWEIFSLSRIPYPGMEYNEAFCEKLLDGYRMKMPQYATEEIYEIMLHCWDGDPKQRPSFSQLVQRIGSILEGKVREHYVDMNSGYIKMNVQRFGEQNSDYLSMVRAPDFEKFSSLSRYVNVLMINDEYNTYL